MELGFKPRLSDAQVLALVTSPQSLRGQRTTLMRQTGTSLLDGDRVASHSNISHSLYSGNSTANNLGGTCFCPLKR